jgi:hypothetical protein
LRTLKTNGQMVSSEQTADAMTAIADACKDASSCE